ncbi:hypothetical protein BDA96_01G571800 [Sorghum bicolor]|uniref:Uncharacterized protein n=1 Tax=Sorghum bicolor TaxID=4558 RepID=A0A921S7I4_SORBI|nr:hypothetical protein BDA96_01G571800 [Sorghum bicolor]
MSDPSVDLEKGIITGLKEEEKGITGLKEEEEVVHQFKDPIEVMCVKRFMDVYPVLFFVVALFGALAIYREKHIWWPALILLACATLTFWTFHGLKRTCSIQHNTLATSADSDLSNTLLIASSKN